MVLPSDEIEIENSEPEISEGQETLEMEVSRRSFEISLNQACAGAPSFTEEQTLPQARPSAKGEFP